MVEVLKDEAVPRTAMVVVGKVLGDEYEKSKLYDPEFTHMFRKGVDAK